MPIASRASASSSERTALWWRAFGETLGSLKFLTLMIFINEYIFHKIIKVDHFLDLLLDPESLLLFWEKNHFHFWDCFGCRYTIKNQK